MSRPDDRFSAAAGHGAALGSHVAECAECQVVPPPLERIAALLDAPDAALDAGELSRRTFLRLQPEIARLAMHAWWRKVAVALLLALLPLPLVLAYDAYLLGVAYQLVSALLPATFAVWSMTGWMMWS